MSHIAVLLAVSRHWKREDCRHREGSEDPRGIVSLKQYVLQCLGGDTTTHLPIKRKSVGIFNLPKAVVGVGKSLSSANIVKSQNIADSHTRALNEYSDITTCFQIL